MIKRRAIIIFFFLAYPFFSIHAMLAPEIAVNDNLKQCQFFQPTGKYMLPEGWRYLEYSGSSFDDNDLKNECEKNGYTFLPGELRRGKIDPYYLSIIIAYNGIFIIIAIFLLIDLIKTKNKKIIIALLGLTLLYLVIYQISRFTV
jgi:hypothetical protein